MPATYSKKVQKNNNYMQGVGGGENTPKYGK